MRHIPHTSFVTMPWRNGGGVTHEILRQGEGSDFDWRISLADVAADGPFSLFPRHDRLLCVITGKGMELRGEHQTHEAELLKPVAFHGSEKIEGVLRDGPCRDFNLIYDPGMLRASLDVIKATDAMEVINPAACQTAFYVVAGSARAAAAVIGTGDFCLLEAPQESVILAPGAVALKAVLQER